MSGSAATCRSLASTLASKSGSLPRATTVLTDSDDTFTAVNEEISGLEVVAYPFDNIEDFARHANDLPTVWLPASGPATSPGQIASHGSSRQGPSTSTCTAILTPLPCSAALSSRATAAL